jgi:hypothetical protein
VERKIKIQRWLVRFIGTLGTKVTEATIEEWSRAQRSSSSESINDLSEEAR